ncbi:MAG: hypothetical protein AMXMBFR84_34370 [Candidatus Hydrogenedentota bacterium]
MTDSDPLIEPTPELPGDGELAAEPGEPTRLTEAQAAILAVYGWTDRVADGIGVWVSVDEQRMRIIQNGKVLWDEVCATAENGTGSAAGSNQTPLGWHSVAEKIGEGAALGQVFRSRQRTKEIWRPGDEPDEDLVLTRILWLSGEEPGKNKGGNVDSYLRYIYIHGTNQEDRLGTPSSHGCVRLSNEDVIQAFQMIPPGTQVLITEQVNDQNDVNEESN